MNLTNEKYSKYALVSEMLETAKVIRNLDINKIAALADAITSNTVLLTGEGSSRIFPAKKTIQDSKKYGYKEVLFTEGCTQALEYGLANASVFVASNSGKTKEGVRLIRKLRAEGHKNIFGVVANAGTPIVAEADAGYVLTCGKEDAVAATKSVVEQALVNDIIFRKRNGKAMPDLNKLADAIEAALLAEVPEEVVARLVEAKVLYWAGRNNGVAEELRLKTNEITRKKSDYLEGTYAAHGIEEVMNADEGIIVVNPFKDEEEKFQDVLVKGVGIHVVAISTTKTSFPAYIIPDAGEFQNYVELVAGWNLLVEVGCRLGINLDKPNRARKIGNEFIG